jgi:hypothetical protein
VREREREKNRDREIQLTVELGKKKFIRARKTLLCREGIPLITRGHPAVKRR